MEALELVLFLLAIVAASSILDRFLPSLSLPLVQIALGAVVAAVFTLPTSVGLDAELLLILFVAPLHFNESRHADPEALWTNRWAIASLAVGLVVVIVVCVGFTLNALLPAIPLAAAFAIGAAMGSTDAVAVTSLTKDYKFGRYHKTLLEGEAFFNDVTGTVIFQTAITMAITGVFSIVHAGEEFALDLFGGLIGGAVMGVLAWLILEGIKRFGVDSPTLHVTLELLLPFLIYLLAKWLHIGAVIAVVSAGLIMSVFPHSYNANAARQKLQSRSVWETLEFILNGVIFVMLGMQLPRLLEPVADSGAVSPLRLIAVICAVTIVLEVVRFFWILVMDMVHGKQMGRSVRDVLMPTGLKGALAMAFAGPKGGITLSLVLTIPAMMAGGEAGTYRELLISITSGVILLTLLLANFGVPLLVPHKQVVKKRRERVDAEIKMLELTIESIQTDSHLTGSVKTASPVLCDDAADRALDADEPATVIVMKRYSDQIKDLMPAASADVAMRARKLTDQCDALYARIKDLAEEVHDYGLGDLDEDDESTQDRSKIAIHFKAIRSVSDDVEDVQSQALTRQLEIIKRMKNDGELGADQANELRNDVYVERLIL